MKSFASLALLVGAPAVATPASDIAEVQAHLRAVTSMTADFAQTDANGQTRTGTLTIKRPGKVRFQYQPSVPLLIVGDGKALTMIDYSVKQVSRWPIGESPLAVLVDPTKDVAHYLHIIPGPTGRLLAQGRDPKHPEFGTITIGFTRDPAAPAGLLLAGWTVVDAQNNASNVMLSNQHFNVPISDKAFLWRDPRPTTRGH